MFVSGAARAGEAEGTTFTSSAEIESTSKCSASSLITPEVAVTENPFKIQSGSKFLTNFCPRRELSSFFKRPWVKSATDLSFLTVSRSRVE